MGAETLSTKDIANNVYRVSVFGFFNPVEGQAEKSKALVDGNNQPTVAYKKENGLYSVKMRMPDGTTECWRETDATHDNASGFKAMAFERRNADGSLYLDKNNQPQVMIMFPGNTGTIQDLQRCKDVVYGTRMQAYYDDSDKFVKQVVAGMDARAQADAGHGFAHGRAEISIGAHSIGAYGAVGQADALKKQGFADVKTLLVEPVGAGRALQDRAKDSGTTQQARLAAAEDIAKNTYTFRDARGNIFQGYGDDHEFANAPVGKYYLVDTHAAPVVGNLTGHLLQQIGNPVMKEGVQALTPADQLAHTPAQLLDGGRKLSPSEISWAREKADAFAVAGDTAQIAKNMRVVNVVKDFFVAAGGGTPTEISMAYASAFNKAATLDLHARPQASTAYFADLNLPGSPVGPSARVPDTQLVMASLP